jgi:hypothetical protein
MGTAPKQLSVAVAGGSATCDCPAAWHSTRTLDGQVMTGGAVSWTVMIVPSVPVAPALSVTVKSTPCSPRSNGTDTVSPLAKVVPFSDQTKPMMSSFVRGLESTSRLAEPSNAAVAFPSPEHSRTWSGPASATGGWFAGPYSQ